MRVVGLMSGTSADGVDAALGFYENLTIGGYWARTHTDGFDGDDDSFQGRFDYFGDRYGARFEYLDVGDDFNPEVGFIQRDDFRRALLDHRERRGSLPACSFVGRRTARGPSGGQRTRNLGAEPHPMLPASLEWRAL